MTLLSTPEVCERLAVPVDRLLRAVKRGDIEPAMTDSRTGTHFFNPAQFPLISELISAPGKPGRRALRPSALTESVLSAQ